MLLCLIYILLTRIIERNGYRSFKNINLKERVKKQQQILKFIVLF